MKPLVRNLAAAALGVVLAFVAAEGLLRATGRRPWRTVSTPALEPAWHDPDPELGWWLRPGHWIYGPYAPGGRPVEVTIAPDRTRRIRVGLGAAGCLGQRRFVLRNALRTRPARLGP